MTTPNNNARKRAARGYAREHGVKYTEALRLTNPNLAPTEAVFSDPGGGRRGWALNQPANLNLAPTVAVLGSPGSGKEKAYWASRLDDVPVPWGTAPDCGPGLQDWGVEHIYGPARSGKTVLAVSLVLDGALGGVTQVVLDTEADGFDSMWAARLGGDLASYGDDPSRVKVVQPEAVADFLLNEGDVMVVPVDRRLAFTAIPGLIIAAWDALYRGPSGRGALTILREPNAAFDSAYAQDAFDRLNRMSRSSQTVLRRVVEPHPFLTAPRAPATVYLAGGVYDENAFADAGLPQRLADLAVGEFLVSQRDGTFAPLAWEAPRSLLEPSEPAASQIVSAGASVVSGEGWLAESYDPTHISSWNVLPSHREGPGVELISGTVACGKSVFAYHRIALDAAAGVAQVVIDNEGRADDPDGYSARFVRHAGSLGLDPTKVRVVSPDALADVVLGEGEVVVVKVPWRTGLTADLIKTAAAVLGDTPPSEAKALTITSLSPALWEPNSTLAEAEVGIALRNLEEVARATTLLLRLVIFDSATPLPATGPVVEWRGRSRGYWRDLAVGGFVLIHGAADQEKEPVPVFADPDLVRALHG